MLVGVRCMATSRSVAASGPRPAGAPYVQVTQQAIVQGAGFMAAPSKAQRGVFTGALDSIHQTS